MAKYRMLFEPKYGDKAKDVCVPPSEDMDYNNADVSRKKLMPEIFAGIFNVVSKTACYDEIMTVETENIKVPATDGYEIPVRVYKQKTPGPHRVMYFIHGGGYCCNNLEIYDYVNRYLCKYSGAVIFAVEYRLAPEYKCPTGMEDCYTGLEWVAANCAGYGCDANTLTVCGDSAGGNFTAALALMARDRKGPYIAKQQMIYPMVDWQLNPPTKSMELYGRGGYFLNLDGSSDAMAKAYFKDVKDGLDPYNSPLLCEDLSGLPEAYFYSAECDPLLDQGVMYAAKLEDAGVKVSYHLYEGMLHGFLNRAFQKTYECMDQICTDLNS